MLNNSNGPNDAHLLTYPGEGMIVRRVQVDTVRGGWPSARPGRGWKKVISHNIQGYKIKIKMMLVKNILIINNYYAVLIIFTSSQVEHYACDLRLQRKMRLTRKSPRKSCLLKELNFSTSSNTMLTYKALNFE